MSLRDPRGVRGGELGHRNTKTPSKHYGSPAGQVLSPAWGPGPSLPTLEGQWGCPLPAWPPPHRAQPRERRLLLLPMVFSWSSGFSCSKLSRAGHTRGIIWRGGAGPQPGLSLWWGRGCCSMPRTLHVPPFPGDTPVAGAHLALRCLPCAPTLPTATLPGGQRTPVPLDCWERDGSSRCHFCHPSPLSCPFPGRDGVGMGLQSSLGSVVFPATKVSSAPPGGLQPHSVSPSSVRAALSPLLPASDPAPVSGFGPCTSPCV